VDSTLTLITDSPYWPRGYPMGYQYPIGNAGV